MNLFENLHEQGNTIILVTHEMDIAQHAHRVIFIRDGKIASDEKVIKNTLAQRLPQFKICADAPHAHPREERSLTPRVPFGVTKTGILARTGAASSSTPLRAALSAW